MLDLVGKNGKDVLEVAKEVALEAGDLLMRRFRSVLEINYKGRGNIVTDVDKEAQDLIQRSLFAEFPEIRFVGEESENPNISNGLCWIVDPIDGTRNFASGIPIFSILVHSSLPGAPWKYAIMMTEGTIEIRPKSAILT